MGRGLVVAVGAVLACCLVLGGCVAVVGGAISNGGPPAAGANVAGSAASDVPAVPAQWEAWDEQAAARCAGLPWTVLAAIGRVESDSGRSSAPGVASGANSAGAEGPLQFEPATFAAYATVGPGGAVPPSPYDPADAVATAATMLCANGAAVPAGLEAAVFDYDHSSAYVNDILVLAQALLADPTLGSVPADALLFAASALGVPYRWGGTGPGGYDCSGLVQAAYRAAGVSLPRVAQDQFDATAAVPRSEAEPGDLVFFGPSAAGVEHVGIYVGSGDMIDAPYTGVDVREESADLADVVGVTRPSAPPPP